MSDESASESTVVPRSEPASGRAPASSQPASAPRSVESPLRAPDKGDPQPRPRYAEPMPADVLAVVLRESNLPGAENDVDSDDGDKALPLELLDEINLPELLTPWNDNQGMTPERKLLWKRLDKDKVVWKRLLGYLMGRHLVPEADAEDIINVAYLRAIFARKWPKDETKSLYGWLRKYVNITRLRHSRASERREEHEIADPNIHWHPAPAAEEEDPEAKFEAQLRAAKHVASLKKEHAQAHAALLKSKETDQPIREIAAEVGIPHATLQKQIQRYMKAVQRYAMVGGATWIVMSLMLFVLLIPGPMTVMGGNHPTEHTPLPATKPATALELRERGFWLCEKGKYEACVKVLDQAKAIDPGGDADPAVVKARGDAAKASQLPSHP